jgi:hypothetical protein
MQARRFVVPPFVFRVCAVAGMVLLAALAGAVPALAQAPAAAAPAVIADPPEGTVVPGHGALFYFDPAWQYVENIAVGKYQTLEQGMVPMVGDAEHGKHPDVEAGIRLGMIHVRYVFAGRHARFRISGDKHPLFLLRGAKGAKPKVALYRALALAEIELAGDVPITEEVKNSRHFLRGPGLAFVVAPYHDALYKATPAEVLKPGEYALAIDGVLYPFGVDAALPTPEEEEAAKAAKAKAPAEDEPAAVAPADNDDAASK